MKTLIILTALLFITACEQNHKQQVTCDSGFKTPISYYTEIYQGVIGWRVVKDGPFFRRKLIPGEICSDDNNVQVVS